MPYTSWKAMGDWVMPRAPNVEGLLGSMFGGTGLLQGGVSDYIIALAVACAFPFMRWLTDRYVYGVRCAAGLGGSCCGGLYTSRLPLLLAVHWLQRRRLGNAAC